MAFLAMQAYASNESMQSPWQYEHERQLAYVTKAQPGANSMESRQYHDHCNAAH